MEQTKVQFTAGEHRLSASAHTSTAHLKLAAAPSLLRPVYAALEPADRPALEAIEGFTQLDEKERRVFEEAMADVDQAEMTPTTGVDTISSAVKEEEEAATEDTRSAKMSKGKDKQSKKQPPQVCMPNQPSKSAQSPT
jgi:hypothetical protein